MSDEPYLNDAINETRQRLELIQTVTCPVCGSINPTAVDRLQTRVLNELYQTLWGEDLCVSCRRRYPAALLKATNDPFEYALRLRTGEMIFFESATIDGEFVHLELSGRPHPGLPPAVDGLPCLFDRGLDVRASDIVWCADAPFGS